jgi:hypothetical protein
VLEGSNDAILLVSASTFLYIWCTYVGNRTSMHQLMNTGTLFSAAQLYTQRESIQSKFTCNSFSNE